MKATDFDLSKGIEFSLENGITKFKATRLVIFDADAVGLLRMNVIKELGIEKARELYLKFGYQNGYSDFLQMKVGYTFDSEMDLLASGPVIHTWEGIVQATPRAIQFDRSSGQFNFTGVWKNSYEATQHLQYLGQANEPVCWSLMGYASGWCTAFFGAPLLAIEPVCMAKGDEHCEWWIQPVSKWGDTAKPYRKALDEFWTGA